MSIRNAAGRARRHFGRHFVGYIALFVAVTMTPLPSQAIGALVKTSDLKNGAVTAPKIKNGAVVAPKIKNGAVGTPKLKNGAVTTAKLRNNAVGTYKLKNGAVTASKLGALTERSASTSIANGTGGFAQVFCEEGEVALGGGASTSGVGLDADWTMIRSSSVGENGWDAAAWNNTGSSGNLIVEVLCLS